MISVTGGRRRPGGSRIPASLPLAALLALLLSGCGFHLRGAVHLPAVMARTQLDGTKPRSPLADDISFALEAAGAEVVESDAGAVLRITRERNRQRLLSVDSLGRASEYELSYELGFELHAPVPIDAAANPKAPPPAVWVPEQVITVTRDFTFDPDHVLGKSDEQTVIQSEMRRSAVRRMLERLEAELHGKELK